MGRARLIDLFSGGGGFSLGAHFAGFSTALAIDIDKDLTYSFKENFPHSTLMFSALLRLDPRDVLRSAGIDPSNVDGIVGGPPCQGFSYIGKKDPRDARNALIGRFFRFVAYVKPSFFVMENVPGLLAPGFRSFLDDGIDELGGHYKVLGPLTLDTSDFGAATKRKRALLVGYLPDRVDPISESDISAVSSFRRITV